MRSQAQTVRQEATGVALDEEARYMLQFQRSYQAVSRMVKVLDELVQDTLSIVS